MDKSGRLLSQDLLMELHFSSFGYFGSVSRVLLIFSILRLTVIVVRKTFNIYLTFKEQRVLLEVIPPARTEQEPYATEQLFALIHMLGSQRISGEALIGYRPRFSFESTFTKTKAYETAFSGTTIPLSQAMMQEVQDRIIQCSKSHYATTKGEVEKQLNTLFTQRSKKNKADKKPRRNMTNGSRNMTSHTDKRQFKLS